MQTGDPVETTLLDEASSFTWKMTTYTFYDEDYGRNYLMVTHDLTSNSADYGIMADDDVIFEISFRSTNDPFVDAKDLMTEDAAQCKMSQNTLDDRFWVITTDDLYYRCQTDYVCAGNAVEDQSDDQQDWESLVTDDDPDIPFCTAPEADSGSEFTCAKLKCIYSRALDTADPDHDFQFIVDDTTSDSMVIDATRAFVSLNFSTANERRIAANLAASQTITISTGAVSLAAVAASLGLMSTLAF